MLRSVNMLHTALQLYFVPPRTLKAANGGVGNRKQSSKARQTAAASHKQELTLALTQSLPDLIHKYQTDAVKVTSAILFTMHTLSCYVIESSAIIRWSPLVSPWTGVTTHVYHTT